MTNTVFTSFSTQHTITKNFPNAVVSVSRAEINNVELTVKAGLTDHETSLPKDLQGFVFIVGPAGTLNSPIDPKHPSRILPTQDGLTPLYNGDGMIYRIGFEQGKATLKTKIAQTTSFVADRITHQNPKYLALEFKNFGITRASFNLGLSTQLSVTLTPFRFENDHPYRLLLSVDIGRPYEVDPKTLELLQPIGSNLDWKSVNPLFPDLAFPMAMGSGHPSFDFERKELFTVNLGKSISSFLPRIRKIFSSFPILNRVLNYAKVTNRRPLNNTGIWHWIEEGIHLLQHVIAQVLTSLIQWSHRHFGLIENLFRLLDKLFKGFVHNDFVDLIRWREDGKLERWKVVLENGEPLQIQQTLHQMWTTRNHIILVDTAFKIALEELLPYEVHKVTQETEKFFRNLTNIPQLADTPIYIIPRDHLISGQSTVEAKALSIPREIAHYIVEYEDEDGIILHTVHGCATDAAETLRSFDTSPYHTPYIQERMRSRSGMLVDGMDIDWIASYILSPDAVEPVKPYLIQQDFCWGEPVYAYRNMTLEPPAQLDDLYWIFYGGWEELLTQSVIDLYRDYPHRTLEIESVLKANQEGRATTLCRVHVERSRNSRNELGLQLTTPDVYAFPAGHFANSPQFVPAQGSTGSTQGYLTCVVQFDDADGAPHSEVWIFDAQNLQSGPQFRLCSDRMEIGFTIHTTWLPEIESPTGINYSIREDFEPLVSKVVQEHQRSWFPSQRRVGKQIRALFDEIYQRSGE